MTPTTGAGRAGPDVAAHCHAAIARHRATGIATHKDLRNNTFQGKLIKAPPNTPEIRLAKAFDAAAAVVPNKWYEKPKVEELLDPGGYGRRIYRVVGANGTHCITVESNHGPDGQDVIQRGIQPKLTDCGTNPPPAATTQAY